MITRRAGTPRPARLPRIAIELPVLMIKTMSKILVENKSQTDVVKII
jgi:hypothetical protein